VEKEENVAKVFDWLRKTNKSSQQRFLTLFTHEVTAESCVADIHVVEVSYVYY